jgi:hypothetical protein
LLSAAPAHSITVISIGFLTNLADLLRSPPDDISSANGVDLVAMKVKKLAVMGGSYPAGWEFNFGGIDPGSAAFVLTNCPATVNITFSGLELGGHIWSGKMLQTAAPIDSPVRAAYEWYMGRCSTSQKSWDPLTTLYGVFGLNNYGHFGLPALFEYANQDGYNRIVGSNGSNEWMNETSVTNQHWLKLANGLSNETVADLLDRLYVESPSGHTCLGYKDDSPWRWAEDLIHEL